tara:strand:- start:2837 stop:2959 length:123 start_codon:yes stop_codon:yes gene_type:complete
MHKIIVMELRIEGIKFVNPLALFANIFDEVPKKTAMHKNK